MIYPSYFAKLRKIPENIVPISICGKAPEWYKGLQYKKLAPKYEFFIEWEKNHNNEYYIEHFNLEVLNKLDVNIVLQELNRMSDNKDIVLLCYEKPSDFCHRHLVANWFNQNNIKCEEYIDF